jgi:hypothetical protein
MSVMTVRIVTGSIALFSGAAAFSFRKGSSRHRMAGAAFCVSMMVMAASGSWLAYWHPSMLGLIGGPSEMTAQGGTKEVPACPPSARFSNSFRRVAECGQ